MDELDLSIEFSRFEKGEQETLAVNIFMEGLGFTTTFIRKTSFVEHPVAFKFNS